MKRARMLAVLWSLFLCPAAQTMRPDPIDAAEGDVRGHRPTVVALETTKGVIRIQVYRTQAPITSNSFLSLVKEGFYDGTPFHRYVEGFVIQGGSRTGPDGVYLDPHTRLPRRIPLEKHPRLLHDRFGTVAMAREAEPNSASCQFYITLDPKPQLDEPAGYAVFGRVIGGEDVVLRLRDGDVIKRAYTMK